MARESLTKRPPRINNRAKRDGSLAALSLAEIQANKRRHGFFTPKQCSYGQHCFIPGADNDVCTKCGFTKPHGADEPMTYWEFNPYPNASNFEKELIPGLFCRVIIYNEPINGHVDVLRKEWHGTSGPKKAEAKAAYKDWMNSLIQRLAEQWNRQLHHTYLSEDSEETWVFEPGKDPAIETK